MLLTQVVHARPRPHAFWTLLSVVALFFGFASLSRAATLVVTTTADSGPGSLRAALDTSRADGDGDVITFDPTVFATRQTIPIVNGLLFAYVGVTIQGPTAGVVLDGSGIPARSAQPILVFGSDTATSSASNLIIQNDPAGSGLDNRFGTLTLTNCVMQGNTSENGGGVFNDGTLTLVNCTVARNTVQQGGAGIFTYGTMTLTGCTLVGNTSGSAGGGIYNGNGGVTLTLTDCTVTGNVAGSNGGGGISSLTGILTVTNCTFTGNTVTTYDNVYGGGGAIALVRGTTTLTNDIFYGDSSPQGGGDEIFFNNGDGSNPGTMTITHCDLVSASVYGAVYTNGGGNLSADPRLGPLQNNGGPTQTRALLPGSPCIDAGTAVGTPPTDQRGAGRAGPPDIGAYEYAGAFSPSGHTHLLWNNSDGRVMLWSIAQDGSFTLSGFGPYTDGAPQNVWHATAVATGPDGLSHLLWNNTDGRVMLWTVDDSGNFTLAGYGPYTDNAPQNKWSAVGVSVGPDNTVHLLWSNTDHRAMLWNVASDFTFTLAGYGPYTDNAPGNLWTATALATGGDGLTRILWNNTDTRVMLWDVDGSFGFTLAGYGPYTDGAPQNKWSAVGVSVRPDNLTHLLWSNTDRRAMFWNVDSAFGFTLAGYGPYTDNGANNLWSATALATGPDGLSHLLWGNTDDRAMLWGVDNALDFSVAGYGPYTDNAPGNLWGVTAVSAGP